MVLSCRHCYGGKRERDMFNSSSSSSSSYMSLLVYGQPNKLEEMVKAVESQDIVPSITIW